jgi:hypothetical protein
MSLSLLIISASVLTGIIVGGWLTMIIAHAAMSRSQEHMEKKVRFWQGEARLARAADGWPEYERITPDYWPGARTDSRDRPHRGYDPSAR